MSAPLELADSSLKFVPVVERVVEGLHRNVKIASNMFELDYEGEFGCAFARGNGRLETRPAFLRDLEAKFDVTRQPKQAAAALGILSPPVFAPLLQNGCTDPSVWLSALVKVVHRCDLETQFGDRSTARTEHKKKRKTQTEEFQALHDARSLPTPARMMPSSSVPSLTISIQWLVPISSLVCLCWISIKCIHFSVMQTNDAERK